MSRWTVALPRTRCGFGDGHDIPEGQPVYLMLGKIVRCADHAPREVSWEAVDAAKLEREAQGLAETTNVAPRGSRAPERGFASFAQTVAPERMAKGLTRRGIRPPKKFAEVAEDPVIRRLVGEDNR